MDLAQILEAFKTDPKLIDGVLPSVIESTQGKAAVDNRVKALFDEKIGEKINELHSQYDNDMFEVLGEKPGQKQDGSKEKTYEKVKGLYAELKELRTKKEGLSKDAEVQRLTAEIEKIKKESGAGVVQQLFDQAKQDWDKQRQDYETKITTLGKSNQDNVVKTDIKGAIASLKLNPDISKTIIDLVIGQVESELLNGYEIKEDKVLFKGKDGKILTNPTTFQPLTALEVLQGMDSVKEIVLKEQGGAGGGAPATYNGKVKTVSVDGKDKKTLELPQGSFKTRVEFMELVEKSLLESGFTKSDKEWTDLTNEAYITHQVDKLPRN